MENFLTRKGTIWFSRTHPCFLFYSTTVCQVQRACVMASHEKNKGCLWRRRCRVVTPCEFVGNTNVSEERTASILGVTDGGNMFLRNEVSVFTSTSESLEELNRNLQEILGQRCVNPFDISRAVLTFTRMLHLAWQRGGTHRCLRLPRTCSGGTSLFLVTAC